MKKYIIMNIYNKERLKISERMARKLEEKNRVKLKITGSEFVIIADERAEYINKIAKTVDKRINELAENDPKLSTSMATILAALNYCDELEKEKKITKELLERIDKAEESAKTAFENLAEFSMKVEQLRVENQRLEEEKDGLHKIIEEIKGKASEAPKAAANVERTAPVQKNVQRNNNQRNNKNPKNTAQQKTGMPKIDYQGNDRINNQYRREEFIDPSEEMISFFDQRDNTYNE